MGAVPTRIKTEGVSSQLSRVFCALGALALIPERLCPKRRGPTPSALLSAPTHALCKWCGREGWGTWWRTLLRCWLSELTAMQSVCRFVGGDFTRLYVSLSLSPTPRTPTAPMRRRLLLTSSTIR